MSTIFVRSFYTTLVSVQALVSHPVFASDLFDLSLEQLLKVKVTVSTLQDESLLSVPSAVTIFTQQQWRRMGITRLEELINFVPGYQAYRGDGAAIQWQFSSRGRRNGYSSLEVLILVDGIRINEDWAGGTFYNTVFSLENVQRVEFLRGPGSAIYGANAFLGVINLVTNNSRELSVNVGTDDWQRLAAQWQKDIGQIELGGSVEYLNSGGQKLFAYNADPNRQTEDLTDDGYVYNSINFNAKYDGFKLVAEHTNSEEDGFYNVGRLLGNKHQETQRSRLNLQYQVEISSVISADLLLGYFQRKHDSQGIQDIASQLFLESNFKERELVVGSTIQFQSEPQSRGVVGFEWRQPNHLLARQRLSGPINLSANIARLDKRQLGGIFGQWQQEFGRWQITGGLRLDHYSDFGSHLSPRLGLIHTVDAENSVKLLYGEAFRAPVWVELYAANNPIAQGNSALMPEIADTWELIWSHVRTTGLFQATVFHVHIEEAIRRNPFTLQFENTGTETLGGLELEYRSQLAQQWQLAATATWISNDVTEINTEANLFGSLSLVYQVNKFSGSLQVHYQGERDNISAANNQNINPLKPRNNTSTHFQYSFSDHSEMYVTVKNFLDQESHSPADNPDNPIGVPNRGRETIAGVRWGF